tara:strand:- start:143 stop:466 length:324 start_codon:yes stop_codon:yes gene_type:complete
MVSRAVARSVEIKWKKSLKEEEVKQQPDPAYNVGDLVKIKPDAFRYFSGRMGIVVQRLGFMYSQDEDEWTMAMYLVSIAVDGDKKFASHVFREDEIDLVSTQIGRRR